MWQWSYQIQIAAAAAQLWRRLAARKLWGFNVVLYFILIDKTVFSARLEEKSQEVVKKHT